MRSTNREAPTLGTGHDQVECDRIALHLLLGRLAEGVEALILLLQQGEDVAVAVEVVNVAVVQAHQRRRLFEDVAKELYARPRKRNEVVIEE